MVDDDLGIIYNYLAEEFSTVPNGKGLVTTLKFVIASAEYRYVLETEDGLLIGYYVYTEKTKNTAELSSVFIAPHYRHTKYARELWAHGADKLHNYLLVKCYSSYSTQVMPKKYYNKYRKSADMKKLYERLANG